MKFNRRIKRNRPLRGYALITLLFVIPAIIVAAYIAAQAIHWGVRAMANADAGSNRIVRTNAVLQRLRADIWQAGSARLASNGSVLVLQSNTTSVRYEIDPQSNLNRIEKEKSQAEPIGRLVRFTQEGAVIELADAQGRREVFSGPMLVQEVGR